MKRAVVLMLTVMITALMIFAISAGAQTTVLLQGVQTNTRGCCSDAAIITTNTLSEMQPVTEFDADEIKEDGINTRVATVWIVCICVVCFVAIVVFAVALAKRNQ